MSLSLFLAAAVLIASASQLQAQESDVLVTKSGPAESAANTDVSYTVDVTNLGPFDAAPVMLTDAIPTGMTFVSSTQDSGPAFVCTAPSPGDTVGSISCTIATLTTGDTASFTFVFHIPIGTPPSTFFVNTANVSSPNDPNSENDSSTAVTATPAPPQADLSISKSGPAGAGPDTDVVYTITLINSGPDDATTVTLNDTLPGTMTFVSFVQNSGPALTCTTPAAGTGGTVSCSTPTFAAGATATFTLTTHIPPATGSGTTFQNIVTVTSDDDPNDENDSSSTNLSVSAADVGVTKTGSATVAAGTDITYTITVTNGGPDTAQDVTLNDVLPPNTTFVSLTQNSGPAAGCVQPNVGANGTVSCNMTVLANGASAQFTLVVEAGNTTSVTNTATVTTISSDTNPANDSASAVTSVTPSADLSVTKNGPASVAAGTNVTYTVTVTNAGPSDASSVSLSDTLPANTTFVSESQTSGPAFSCATPAVGAGGTITCTISTFPTGSTADFSFTLQVAPAAPNGSTIANTADVSATTLDSDSGNNSSTTTATVVNTADLAVVKSGPAAVSSGSDATYTVTVTNNGPVAAANVSLTDSVPANTTFVSESQTTGPTFSCATPASGGTGTITCTIATLASGASATFSFVVHVAPATPDGTIIANTADVSTTTTDPNSGNNSSTSNATVAAVADVTVGKTGPSSVTAGSNASYVVTVTNNGPADAASVTLTDILPPNTTFVSESQTSGPTFACTTPAPGAAGTITCTIASLPAGTSAAFTIVMHVAPQATGTVANTATVTSPSDSTPGNNAGTSSAAISVNAGVPTLSPLALAIMVLALVGIALFVRGT